MKQNLLKTSFAVMALAVTVGVSAQSAARLGRVDYWDLTQEYSDATKAALIADAQWNRTGSGGTYSYRYGMPLANEAVVYNETDLIPNLKFTVTDGNRLVFTSSLLQVQKSSGLKIALPELAAGNVVEIKTTCGDSKYLTFENKTADTDYSETTAPTATTSEQTYKYTILEGKGGSDYVLIPNEANTSKSLDITSIKIYENATKAEAGTETLHNWTFSTYFSTFSGFNTSKHTWSWSSNGFYPSTSSYSSQVLNVPFVAGNNDNGITELDGLKFTTTENTKIRIDANSGKTGVVLIKAGENALGLGKVIVPITRLNSKVKVTNSKTVRQRSGATSDETSTEAEGGYFTASADPFYFGCYGNNDTRVTAIAVLDKFATVSDGSPTNGSLAFASTANEVTKDEAGTDVVNGFFCGSTVTVTATPNAGYYLSALTGTYYQDSENTAVELTITGSGNTRTFTMPTTGDVTLTATFTSSAVEEGDNGGSGDSNTTESYTITDSDNAQVTTVTTTSGASSVTIPASVNGVPVTSIADDAFSGVSDKSAIKSIDLSATSITGVTVGRLSGVFSGFDESTIIYMPAGNTTTEKNVVIGGTCADFVMTDLKSYNFKSFTATKTTLTRSFTADQTCTICLPYNVPSASYSSIGKIYRFSSISGSTVQMTEDTDGLDANVPYIFKPSAAGTEITDDTGGVTVQIVGNNTTADDFTFTATYEDKTFTAEEIAKGVYGFAATAEHGASSAGQFIKATTGASIKGMRAYLIYSGVSSDPGLTDASARSNDVDNALPETMDVVLVDADGQTTHIGQVQRITDDADATMYNMNGQKVSKDFKGLVIKNGKKTIIK